MPALAKILPQPVAPADFDRWRAARTTPAASVVGYTPVEQLFEDFCLWAAVAIGTDDFEPTSFRAAMNGTPKPFIAFETLPCRVYFQRPQMAECASLSLRDPIRVR